MWIWKVVSGVYILDGDAVDLFKRNWIDDGSLVWYLGWIYVPIKHLQAEEI